MRRALRSLIPVLAAAATWVSLLRCCLNLCTWWSVILLPGIPLAFDTSKTHGSPASRDRPGFGLNRPR